VSGSLSATILTIFDLTLTKERTNLQDWLRDCLEAVGRFPQGIPSNSKFKR
jgi:hypothetical protein